MIHELKILPEYYEAIMNGTKKFEVRKDDRGFEVGHTLYLREWNSKVYTHRIAFKQIGYIHRDFGLKKDFCILGFK